MSERDDPYAGASVPSMGSLFEDPGSTPPVVPARASTPGEGGRLYRSAYAAGPAAALAIQALARPREAEPDLPVSPEAVAAAAAAAAAAVPSAEPPAAEPGPEAAPASAAPAAGAGEPVPDDPPTAEPAVASAAALAAVAAAAAAAPAALDDVPSEDVPTAMPVEPLAAPEAAPSAEPVASATAPTTPAEPAAEAPVLPEAQTPAASPAVAALVPDPIPVQPAVAAPAVLALPVAEPEEDGGLPWLTWTQGTLLIIGVTLAASIIDVLLRHGIGAITGVGLMLGTVIAGLRLQREDIWAAVVVPPLAFVVALVTVGQFGIGTTGGFVSRQALNLVTGLSLNAPWILGATAIGLVIVLVRRHRDGSGGHGSAAGAAPVAGAAESADSAEVAGIPADAVPPAQPTSQPTES